MKKLALLAITSLALMACNERANVTPTTTDAPIKPIVIEGQNGFQGVTTLPATIITGQVIYRERIALTTPYTMELELFEIEGANRKTVGSVQSLSYENQVPINFVFSYDSSLIDHSKNYGLQARIIENGKITWQNAQLVNPFTEPREAITILVTR